MGSGVEGRHVDLTREDGINVRCRESKSGGDWRGSEVINFVPSVKGTKAVRLKVKDPKTSTRSP